LTEKRRKKREEQIEKNKYGRTKRKEQREKKKRHETSGIKKEKLKAIDENS
jgi:hypothetical protein